MAYVSIGCQSFLALIFLVACVSKVQNAASYRSFRESLGGLGLRPGLAVRILSIGIPAAEAITTLMLIVSSASWWGLVASAALLTSFTLGIGIAASRGRKVTCRCFGESSASTTSQHILRNGLLLTTAVAGLLAGLAPAGHTGSAITVFSAGCGVISAALFLRWDELAFLFRPLPRPGTGR